MVRLTRRRRRLVESHYGAVAAFAGRLSRRWGDDLDWLGLMGRAACMAALTYRTGRGAGFALHLKTRLEGAYLDALRRTVPAGFRRNTLGWGEGAPRVSQLSAVAWRDNGDLPDHRARHPVQIPSGDLPVGWELESEDAVRALAAPLPGYCRAVVAGKYLRGLTFAAIGREMGYSESRIKQFHDEALATLRRRAGLPPVAEKEPSFKERAEKAGIGYDRAHARLMAGWPPEAALDPSLRRNPAAGRRTA